MTAKTRTAAACLASAEQDARAATLLIHPEPGGLATKPAVEGEEHDLDMIARKMLIARVRRAEVAENAGAIGIIAAIFCVTWMLARCVPTLLPELFQ